MLCSEYMYVCVTSSKSVCDVGGFVLVVFGMKFYCNNLYCIFLFLFCSLDIIVMLILTCKLQLMANNCGCYSSKQNKIIRISNRFCSGFLHGLPSKRQQKKRKNSENGLHLQFVPVWHFFMVFLCACMMPSCIEKYVWIRTDLVVAYFLDIHLIRLYVVISICLSMQFSFFSLWFRRLITL